MADKKFPTPEMLKAEEEWAKIPEAERKAFRNAFREELRRHFENRPSRERRMLLEELQE